MIGLNISKDIKLKEDNKMKFDTVYNLIIEKTKKQAPKNVCWKGYKMVGTKNKGGKKVPNCVPNK